LPPALSGMTPPAGSGSCLQSSSASGPHRNSSSCSCNMVPGTRYSSAKTAAQKLLFLCISSTASYHCCHCLHCSGRLWLLFLFIVIICFWTSSLFVELLLQHGNRYGAAKILFLCINSRLISVVVVIIVVACIVRDDFDSRLLLLFLFIVIICFQSSL